MTPESLGLLLGSHLLTLVVGLVAGAILGHAAGPALVAQAGRIFRRRRGTR